MSILRYYYKTGTQSRAAGLVLGLDVEVGQGSKCVNSHLKVVCL